MKHKPQLFCFSHAGGTAAFFDIIEKDLPMAELVKMEYAGHGQRYKEEFYRGFDALAEDMFSKMKEAYAGGSYALFGYSMGSITLVEVLKRILNENLTLPDCVFLAAHEPHTKSELLGYADNELDEWVKKRTIRFGAVPERLLHNRPFWRMYLPLYRADYSIIGAYQFEKLNIRTTVPAVIFYSETDTPRKEMELWERYFVGEVSYHRLEGQHFFILEHHREMADRIAAKLGV